jgi:hypothetical protein
MVEPLRHRQTKEAATHMFDLQQPCHTSTPHDPDLPARPLLGRYWGKSDIEHAALSKLDL